MGVVVFGGLLSSEEAPRRSYRLEFERAAVERALEEAPKEELARLDPEPLAEPNLDPDALLRPERVRPRPDPEALVDAPREVVPEPADERWKHSAEVVLGYFEPEVNPEPDPETIPEPASTPELGSPVPEDVAPPAPEPPTETEVLPAPKRLEGTDPTYPKVSKRLGEQGSVVLRLAIDTEGRVTLVELETSSGFRRLDQAAMSAAPTWVFEVPTSGPPSSFVHTVHFLLQRR